MSELELAAAVEAGELTDSGEQFLFDYIDKLNLSVKKAEEAERVQQEARQNTAELLNRVQQGINIGTEQDPEIVREIQVDKIVTQDAGGVHEYSYQQMGDKLGIRLMPETDEVKEAKAAALEERHTEMRQALSAQRGKTVTIDGQDYTLVGVVGYPSDTTPYRVIVQGADGEHSFPFSDEDIGQLARQLDEAHLPEPAVEVGDDVPRDFRGNPLPMRQNEQTGEQVVDEDALRRKDIEAWVRYNDANPARKVSSRDWLTYNTDKLSKAIEKAAGALRKAALDGVDEREMDKMESELTAMNQTLASYQSALEKYTSPDDIEGDMPGYLAGEPAQQAQEEKQASGPVDFRGRPIPLDEGGEVDEGRLFQESPEAWMEWNTAQMGDEGEDSKGYVKAEISRLSGQIGKLEKGYKKEADFKRRKEIRGQIEDVKKRITDLGQALKNVEGRRSRRAARELEPQTVDEVIANGIAAFKGSIDRDELKRETGMSDADLQGLVGGFVKEGGMSIGALAEQIKTTDDTGITSHLADDELRSGIIEFLQGASKWSDITNYIANKRTAQKAEEERQAQEAIAAAREESTHQEVPRYQLSDEVDENGRQFVLNSKGEIEFGRIPVESGLTSAPILLSEGEITNPATNDGYGLVHIEARHGEQIRNAGFTSVIEFIENVAQNYEVIRKGKDRDGNQTYMLQLTDKHNNTLMVELSGDGTYWNINTAGIFKTSYGAKRDVVYNRPTSVKQPVETVEATQEAEQGDTDTSSSRNNTPTQLTENKDSEISETSSTQEEKVDDLPEDLPGEGGKAGWENRPASEIQGFDGLNSYDIYNVCDGFISELIRETGLNIAPVDMIAVGSRAFGTAREDSDLDILLEYEGDVKEDGVFNALNAEPLEILGIKVDFFPIRPQESGTLTQWLESHDNGRPLTPPEQEATPIKEPEKPHGPKYRERIADILSGKDKTRYKDYFFTKTDFPDEEYDEVVRQWDEYKRQIEEKRKPLQQRVSSIVSETDIEAEQEILEKVRSQGKTIDETTLYNAKLDVTGKKLKNNAEYQRLIKEIDALDKQTSPSAKEEFRQNAIGMLKAEYAKLKSQAERELRKLRNKKEQHRQDQIYIESQLKHNAQVLERWKSDLAKARELLAKTKEAFPGGKITDVAIEGRKAKGDTQIAEAIKEKITKPVREKADFYRDKAQKLAYSAEGVGEVAKFNLSFNGIPMELRVAINALRYYDVDRREYVTSVKVQPGYVVPSLGIDEKTYKMEEVPGGINGLKNVADMCAERVASGQLFKDDISGHERSIARKESDNELMIQRRGKPFSDEEKLAKQEALVKDYTEKMKAETAEKEAEYAELAKNATTKFNLDGVEVEDEDEADSAVHNREADQNAPRLDVNDPLVVAEASTALNRIARRLNLDVHLVTDARGSEKGYYKEGKTSVTINLNNCESIDDAVETLLHEGVAHYGLCRLLGEQGMREFIADVLKNASGVIRNRIQQMADERGWSLEYAAEEYIAELAEKTDYTKSERSFWRRLLDAVRNFIDIITGRQNRISDDTIREMLVASFDNLENNVNLQSNGERPNENQDDERTDSGRVAGNRAGRDALRSDRGDIRMYEAEMAAERHDDNGDPTGFESRRDEAHRLIGVAKENGTFIPVPKPKGSEFGEELPMRSRESSVFRNMNTGKVTKFKDPFALLPMKQNAVQDAIYEHLVHKYYFPDTRYEFKGISALGNEVRFLLEQDYVDWARRATQQEVEEYLNSVGLTKQDNYWYGNDLISVTDVEKDNVLVDANGVIRFIDPVIRFNKPAKEVIETLLGYGTEKNTEKNTEQGPVRGPIRRGVGSPETRVRLVPADEEARIVGEGEGITHFSLRTNPNPETDPWIITGAMKVNRILTDEEVDDIMLAAGREPQKREPIARNREAGVDVFISNAEVAVRGIRQEKATPEQWLKMLESRGGLKAGEDKWLGPSDWLKGQDRKTLTKQEGLDYINQNKIQIEETDYSEGGDIERLRRDYPTWDEAFYVEENEIGNPEARIETWEEAVELYNSENISSPWLHVTDGDLDEGDVGYDTLLDWANKLLAEYTASSIDSTRLELSVVCQRYAI